MTYGYCPIPRPFGPGPRSLCDLGAIRRSPKHVQNSRVGQRNEVGAPQNCLESLRYNGPMEKSWREKMHQKQENKVQETEYVEKGWVSTGDLPYRLARSLQMKSPSAAADLQHVIRDFIANLDDTYRDENLKPIGRKKFASPDFVAKIEENLKKNA